MLGNGVDMYDLIPNLKENDIHLSPTNESIWIGVIEKICPSTPVPRKKTHCYTRCPVYFYKGRRVFEMVRTFEPRTVDYYYIPDEELIFVEKNREVAYAV